MKQNLNPSKMFLAVSLQEGSNEFPFPGKGAGFSFHVFCRLLWSCAFLCLPKSKEKYPLKYPQQIVTALSSVLQSQLQRASNSPAWIKDGLTAQTSLNQVLFKKITPWDRASQPINQEKNKCVPFLHIPFTDLGCGDRFSTILKRLHIFQLFQHFVS